MNRLKVSNNPVEPYPILDSAPVGGQQRYSIVQEAAFGYAYYFRALQDYHAGSLSLLEVLVFEHLVWLGEHWLKQRHASFWHSSETIHKSTGIATNTIRRIVRKLEDERLITREVKLGRTGPISFFTVRFAHVASRMPYLFGGKEFTHPPEKLARIARRQRALRGMARMQADLVSKRKALVGR